MTNYLTEALSLGHYHTPCRECGGHGYVIDEFGDMVECLHCDGTGNLRGKCGCGRWGWLLHDASPHNDELACARCLVLCDNCCAERATAHIPIETYGGPAVERLCADCAMLIEGTIR